MFVGRTIVDDLKVAQMRKVGWREVPMPGGTYAVSSPVRAFPATCSYSPALCSITWSLESRTDLDKEALAQL